MILVLCISSDCFIFEVMVLVLCMLSDDALYLYKNS